MKFNRTFLASGVMTLCLTGCVPYRYIANPYVSGRVVDAHTHRPLIAAKARFASPQAVASSVLTMADGSFALQAEKRWGVLCLIATPSLKKQSVLILQAPGYISKEVPLGWSEPPIYLDKPIELSTIR